MGRPLRIEYPGALYHVTSRGNERKDIFIDDPDRKKFLGILGDYHDRYGILAHCYILMGNHYHLVMETPQGNLLKVMHGVNSGYTGYFNRKYGRSGHLFQGRYRGILVDKDAYLLELSRYVHLNPVRAGIVDRPEQYKWSSYPGYIWKRKEVDWVEYAWVLSHFGQDRESGKKRYREFVNNGLGKERTNPLKELYGQMILGKDAFIEKTVARLKGEAISQEIVERKRLKNQAKPEEIVAVVAAAFGIEEEKIKNKGGRDNIAKKMAIYLIKRYAGLSNQEIGNFFGGMHYSAVSKSSVRFEREMEKNGELSSFVKKLVSNVKT